ncbi:unnamed protein product [Pleuronectes platessa]|uniref:Uncharacterized protein n=1 Tax=Pleuronectes platessa TaxID=8262 RepID=A0A9N7V2D1_PLEPL|nr:unnamed protein product [Pleuronectes platessa]
MLLIACFLYSVKPGSGSVGTVQRNPALGNELRWLPVRTSPLGSLCAVTQPVNPRERRVSQWIYERGDLRVIPEKTQFSRRRGLSNNKRRRSCPGHSSGPGKRRDLCAVRSPLSGRCRAAEEQPQTR